MAKTATNTVKVELISKEEHLASKPKKVTPMRRRSSMRVATKLSLKADVSKAPTVHVSKAAPNGKGPIKKRPIKLTAAPSPCSDASTPGLSATSTLHGLKQDEDKTINQDELMKDELMKGTDEEAATKEDVRAIDDGSVNKEKGATISSNPVQVAVHVNDSFWEVPATISEDDPPPSTPPTMPLESTSSCFSGPFIQDTGESFAGKQLFDGAEGDTPLPFNSSLDYIGVSCTIGS